MKHQEHGAGLRGHCPHLIGYSITPSWNVCIHSLLCSTPTHALCMLTTSCVSASTPTNHWPENGATLISPLLQWILRNVFRKQKRKRILLFCPYVCVCMCVFLLQSFREDYAAQVFSPRFNWRLFLEKTGFYTHCQSFSALIQSYLYFQLFFYLLTTLISCICWHWC